MDYFQAGFNNEKLEAKYRVAFHMENQKYIAHMTVCGVLVSLLMLWVFLNLLLDSEFKALSVIQA